MRCESFGFRVFKNHELDDLSPKAIYKRNYEMKHRRLTFKLNPKFYIKENVSLFDKAFQIKLEETDKFEEKLGFIAQNEIFSLALMNREDREFGVLNDASDTVEFKFGQYLNENQKSAFEINTLETFKKFNINWDSGIWVTDDSQVFRIHNSDN